MEKKPFLTEAMAQQIIEDVPTPFHVYDEKGIRENVRRINKAFSWNKGFKPAEWRPAQAPWHGG